MRKYRAPHPEPLPAEQGEGAESSYAHSRRRPAKVLYGRPRSITVQDTRPMNAPVNLAPPYRHSPLFPLGKDTTPYRKLSSGGVRVRKVMGEEVVVVPREALRALSEAAFVDLNHPLRPW